jgi:hypothetical protein
LQDQIAAPEAVAIDPVTGTLYASNTDPVAIYEYDTPLISQTATRAFGNCHPAGGFGFGSSCLTTDAPGPVRLYAPTGIAVDRHGNLFVADGAFTGSPEINGRLLMFLNPHGSSTGCTPNGDGSGCAGDTVADSVVGTLRWRIQLRKLRRHHQCKPQLRNRRMGRHRRRQERKPIRDGSGELPRAAVSERQPGSQPEPHGCAGLRPAWQLLNW